jgi:hypothetical protein
MHEHGPAPNGQPGVFAKEERDVIWLESGG